MSTGTRFPSCIPELWGGVECTINRVNNKYRDQLAMAGHYTRAGDIERFAQLGIRKLRYPILWEHHQQYANQKIDWRWTEQQLDTIRKNKIVPIAGLVHHGSGPRFTDLADKDFPQKLAAYAEKVAEKFPWLLYYTPVNEPMTTARFSGLYGIWYPHQQNELAFVEMLLNQLKAVVLSMQAIRKINPAAQLVQTEDLSKTYSTPLLSYQADFENQRRWLTNDLLCGKVDKENFFWDYFISLGIAESSLQFFLNNPCPPSIIGFNYYVTSERWIDENIDDYPECTHGGNGKHIYSDTEAVRSGHNKGLHVLLEEAWQHYQIPCAITECHLSCTREEQLRWFKEVWDDCCSLKNQGVGIKAVTAWSLLGAYDWNSLLTGYNNYYEPGVFDISNNRVRPTALHKMICSLSDKGSYDHPLFAKKGWWRLKQHDSPGPSPIEKKEKISPLLLIGKTGTLGKAFIKICEQRSIPFIALGRQDINILDENSIRAVIEKNKPWAIINATGYVNVDEAEMNPLECYAVNATAPALLAKLCFEYGTRFMSFSSDLVFDGNKQAPYYEEDTVLPLNNYGFSKSEGEKLILAENSSALIIRTSAFFGPWDRYNFVYAVLDALKKQETFFLPRDVIISPTYVPDLCHTAMDLFIDEERGIWHLSNDGIITWADFGGIIAERACCKKHKLISKPLIEMGWKAKRPLYSVLQSDKGVKLPRLDDALDRFFEQRLV
ncbi:MAG: family 1 glycosylhydrolase [Chitinophagaceae bacterium]